MAWHLAALCLLFVGLVSMVWKFGVVCHDDGEWILESLRSPVANAWTWAAVQGRLYALPGGLLMLQGYRLDGSNLGELLKFGSFGMALAGIGAVLSAYWGRRIAVLSIGLFLGLLALQFDFGSPLLAYPLLIWPPVIISALAVLAGRRHVVTGRAGWLAISGAAAFLSFFTNEGMMLAFLALMGICWYGNLRVGAARRNRILGFTWGAAFVLFAAAAWWFHLSHPTNYEGTQLATFDLAKTLGVLASFSTGASDLHSLFFPYQISYTDAIIGTRSRITYGFNDSFQDLAGGFRAFVLALILGGVSGSLLRRAENSPTPPVSLPEGSAVLPGLAFMLLPILPVSLVSRYQDWHSEFGVGAYLTTTVAHLGLSMILAATACSLVRRTGRARRPVAALFACAVAVLCFAGLRADERIAGDIRPEAARWEVLRRAIPLLSSTGWNTEVIAAPQLASGSWFAVMTPRYWSDFASIQAGYPINVLYGVPAREAAPRGATTLAYIMSEDRRSFDLVLAHQLWDNEDRSWIDAIVVRPGRFTDSEMASLVLSYLDRQGILRQVHLRDLRRDGRRFTLDSADAVPGSIRLMRQSMPR